MKKHKISKFWIGIIIITVISSVMAAGFEEIGRSWFPNDDGGIYMLAPIFPMVVFMLIIIRIIYRHIEKKINPLIDSMSDVANGNLDIYLDSKKAGEYKEAYDSFNIMTKELKSSKAEMQNFINEFTHEFKTPITSISGFADVLYETGNGIEDKERMNFLKIISEQSHRLSNLAQNTLLLSKVEATQIVTEKENFSLSEQIKQCVIMLLPQFDKKNITVNIDDDFNFEYYGNAELTEQIWINLLNNAIKFTPKNGEIFIYSDTPPGFITVNIKDTGIGMDAETQKHIFEKYYQNDTCNIAKGNGIGLSIVKRIVELCNGQIKVKSQLKQGSTFSVTLPILR